MKCITVIDETCEEQVFIYAREKSALVKEIEELVRIGDIDIIGYDEAEAIRLKAEDIECFYVTDSRVMAVTENGTYSVKSRLYRLEESLGDTFIKINQSCIINIKKTDRFRASVGGALEVTTKSGFKDYVSRRCVKAVKERLGLK